MKQQTDLRVVRGSIDGISWVFAVGPASEPCLSCPKTNEGPPPPPERRAEPDKSAPAAKAPRGNRKLTLPQAEAIRLLLRCGQSQRRVARLFNASRGAITKIARGTTWKGRDSDELRVPSCELKSEAKGKGTAPGPAPEEDGGVWLVTETVQVPGVLLDIPCGMFRSKEQAQAYLREQGERFQLRRIEGDWNQGSDELRVTSDELKPKQITRLRAEVSCELKSKGKPMQPIAGKEKA